MSGLRKQCFVFCHGFGFDATFWDSLRPYFTGVDAVYLDLGYFMEGRAADRPYENYDSCDSIDFIGIGHSLGLMKLMSLNIKFKYLIGLHGFVHFLGFDQQLHRRRERELMHLTKQFIRSPESTLMKFYQRAGVTWDLSARNAFNQMRLLEDLASLAHPMQSSVPMLVLGSNDDKITPPELIEDNFSHHAYVTVHILNHAQHGLGYLKPELVYKQIRAFLGYEYL